MDTIDRTRLRRFSLSEHQAAMARIRGLQASAVRLAALLRRVDAATARVARIVAEAQVRRGWPR
jgi:hypothetical protein